MSTEGHIRDCEKSFESMLSGGNPNSLGRTIEVVEIVLGNKEKLSELFDCYLSEDKTVKLRVSNAFKRIFRQNRNWFVEYIDKFQHLIPTLNQPSAEWTLAQLHLETKDLLSAEQIKNAVEISKKQLNESKDWIVIMQSMNFLEQMAKGNHLIREWLFDKLEIIAKDKRKSLSKRANTILQSLK